VGLELVGDPVATTILFQTGDDSFLDTADGIKEMFQDQPERFN
jgi:hypothetical protein